MIFNESIQDYEKTPQQTSRKIGSLCNSYGLGIICAMLLAMNAMLLDLYLTIIVDMVRRFCVPFYPSV